MGIFTWFWDLIKRLFTRSKRIRAINEDIGIDGKILVIDKKRKKIEKFENKNCKSLITSAYIIFDNTNKQIQGWARENPNYNEFERKIFEFINIIQKIRDSPGIQVEFSHLRELYSVWRYLSPNLKERFSRYKEIKKAIKNVEKRIKLLAKEIKKEKGLLSKEEDLEGKKQVLDRGEE